MTAHAVQRIQGYGVVRVVRVLRPDGRLLKCRVQDPEDGVIEVFVVGGREQRRRRQRDAHRRDRHPREDAEPSQLRERMRPLYAAFPLSIHFRLPFLFFLHRLAVLGRAQRAL